jgi:hypothetical protein
MGVFLCSKDKVFLPFNMKKVALILIFFCFMNTLFAQDVLSHYTVYLIGDAGKDTAQSGAVAFLKDEIEKNPNSTVVFLGDNVYPRGVEKEISLKGGLSKSQKKMNAQLRIFKGFKGKVFMLPGNHDWDKCSWNGKQKVMEEASYVNTYMRENSSVDNRFSGVFYPENAGPGPHAFLLTKGLRLIILDTQWWLQQQFFHPVGKDPGQNKKATEHRFYKSLDSLLDYSRLHNEKVIMAAHHPLYSIGKHSLKKEPWRSLVNYTPFQILGLLGLNRVYMQDTEQPRYKRMKQKLLKVMAPYNNIIYACGHDHNMQFSLHDSLYHIVSGSGSMHSKLKKDRAVLFSCKNQLGFYKLSCFADGLIRVEAMGAYRNDVLFSYDIKP